MNGTGKKTGRETKVKHMEKEERTVSLKPLFSILTGMLAGYILTLLGLFVLALLLLQLHLSEATVEIGIIVLYLISVFTAGFIVGKLMKTRKFLWGMLAGLAYYVILVILSALMQKNLAINAGELVTVLCLCTGGGMLGGMLS